MATTAIHQDIAGVICHIDYYAGGYLKIRSTVDGKRYSVHQNRIVNAPHAHRCLCRVGDEITFTVNPDEAVVEIRFVTPPDAELPEEETSVVVAVTTTGLVFGERIQPDCRCPLLLGTIHKNRDLDVGMVVRHGLGIFNNKVHATNLKINWNAYGEGEIH